MSLPTALIILQIPLIHTGSLGKSDRSLSTVIESDIYHLSVYREYSYALGFLFIDLFNDLFSENQAEAVAQAAASNEYGRLQKESKEMAVITEKSKWTSTMLLLLILVLICTFMTLSLLALCGFYVLRNRKNKVINQKIREIELLQGTIVRMEEGKESPNDHLEEFEESDIVIHLRQKAEKKESANVAELTDLKDAAIKHIPVFIQTLGNTSYELQRHETYLCILIKAGFRPSEIAILMNMTNMKKRSKNIHTSL